MRAMQQWGQQQVAHGAPTYGGANRMLACDACGAALSVPAEGGTQACGRCGASLTSPPRPSTEVPKSPPTDEMQRRMRIRAQDGQPLLPPPGLEHLGQGGTIPPHQLQEARAIWSSTRQHLRSMPSDIAAAERLLWLVRLFRNSHAGGDRTDLRALIEASLEVMSLPRHRQLLRCSLARESALAGDLQGAEAWLAGCDPYSEEIAMDSEYRITRAYVDTASNRFDGVLQVLGASEQEVAIQDALDPLATVLRANAFERQGNLPAAQQLLARFMTAQGMSRAVESIVGAMPQHWYVCHQSLQFGRQHARQALGSRAASGGGGMIMGAIVAVAGGGLPLVMLVVFIASGEFELPMLFMLIFPFVFGSMGVRMMMKAHRAGLIAREGIHGRGRVLQVTTTGTRINDVPVMRIDVEVHAEGHPPVQASTSKLAYPGQLQGLVGREVGVIWHPKYPNDVVMDL